MTGSELSKASEIISAEAANLIKPDVWVVEGTEVRSGEPLRILYAGGESERHYFAQLAFEKAYHEAHVGTIYLWSLRSMLAANSLDCSMAVIDGHFLHRRIYGGKGDFFIPLWFEGVVDIPLAAHNKSTKYDLNKVKRNQLDYVVTDEECEFRRFYDEMYVPYVAARFEDSAVSGIYAIGYDDIMRMVRRGACELLLVRKGDEFISGVTIVFGDRLPRLWARFFGRGLPRLWASGIKDGDASYLLQGASVAQDYFSSLYLSDQGYETMHVGLSRAFLGDGVVQYKKKWRMRVVDYIPRGFLVKPLRFSPAVKGFLTRNPFAHVCGKQLCGAIFCDDSSPSAEDTFEQLYDEYGLTGLSAVHIYQFDENGTVVRRTFSGDVDES